VRFTFIKATEGGDHLDPKFLQNWQAAKNAGVVRGAYHFVYWCRPADEQALWFMLNVPPDPNALPPVLDLEWNSASKTCPHHVSREVALGKIKIMLDAMQAHTGKQPIIYTDPVFYRDVLDGSSPTITTGCARSPPSLATNTEAARGRFGSSPPRALSRVLQAASTATASTAPSATGSAC
jgi:GH25 family lysozyme M1 (1,4-beta-N-acetylmuramidase)